MIKALSANLIEPLTRIYTKLWLKGNSISKFYVLHATYVSVLAILLFVFLFP